MHEALPERVIVAGGGAGLAALGGGGAVPAEGAADSLGESLLLVGGGEVHDQPFSPRMVAATMPRWTSLDPP